MPTSIPTYLPTWWAQPSAGRAVCRNRATADIPGFKLTSTTPAPCLLSLAVEKPEVSTTATWFHMHTAQQRGRRLQGKNVVTKQTEASDSSHADALCRIFNILDASQQFQRPEHLVSIHSAPFHASDLLISCASFATRAHHPAGVSWILTPCFSAILAIIASSPAAKCRPAASPSPLGGNTVHCAD